jgi:signal transduction histidine kinase
MMTLQNKVGSKLIFIYLFSLCLALSSVLVVAQSIITQQIHRRYQKKLDSLTQKVFFSLEKQKDQVRLLARVIANFGRLGALVTKEERHNIRALVASVFKESDLDVLYIFGQDGRELVQLQSERFHQLGRERGEFLKKAIVGNFGVRFNKWEDGIAISGSAHIHDEEEVTGMVFVGTLVDNTFLEELAKGMDSFLAIVKDGKVMASTFSGKGEEGDELEFSEDVLQDIRALKGNPLPVLVEEKSYTMKSLPLMDQGGIPLGFLVIGLSRAELNQTVSALRRIILEVGGGGALLGILLMIVLTSKMRRQITYLSAGTDKVTSGNLAEIIPEISKDELGGLARSFNHMAEVLKERDRVLQEEKEKILANVDFLSMIVHDSKAPLAGVNLMIETLLEEDLSREVKQRLSGMGESIEELLGHLYNVLTISNMEKGPFSLKLDPVDLNASVRYVRSQCQILADRKGIQVFEELDRGLPVLEGDEFYLERLIYNLLTNAIHWTPGGGWVKIKTGLQGGDRIFLEVADSGPGIPAGKKPDLFKKYTSHPEKGDLNGTHSGLGLHICQTILQAHGGILTEEGRPGEGARFVGIFPLPVEVA